MRIKAIFLQLAKLSFFAMLCYSSFLMELLEIKIAHMTLALGMLTAVFVFLDMSSVGFDLLTVLTPDVKHILLYVMLCILGALAATHRYSAIDGIVQLLQSLLLMVITIYICIRDGSIKFCARTVVVVMGVAALYALLNAQSFDERVTLSESGNANVFGHNAILGICLAPLAFGMDCRLKRIFHMALVVVFAFAVIISASRMSFITLVAYLVLYVFIVMPRQQSNSRFSQGLRFLGIVILATVAVLVLSHYLQGTLIIERMEELFNVLDTGEGDGASRMYLYEEAWRTFLSSPFFGVGYANFGPMHYGVYTHSTYAEILSCTGLAGFSAFAAYYWYICRELIRGVRLDHTTKKDINYQLALVFLALLLLGIGEILIYKIKYFIVFGLLAAQFYLNKKETSAHIAE